MKQTSKESLEQIDIKKGFFKKVKTSIFNVEKYPELATEGVPRALSYFIKLVLILAIVICAGMTYQIQNMIKQGIEYLKNDFPEFSYQNGALDIKSENPITIDEKTVGKIIIDTKTEDREKINQYTNQITEKGGGILILKDELIIKNSAIMGTATYEYNKILEQMGLTRFEKQDVINYAQGSQMISIYATIFITLLMYAFIIYFLNTIAYVLLISTFGYLASLFAKVRMRYAAIFNMSIYASTLSILLNCIYLIINTFVNFNIEYFDVMYISVAVIYLFAAIFIIKDDLIKKQAELIKIMEVQAQVKKELKDSKEEERKNENEKPKEEEDKKKDEKEEKKESGQTPAPEGSNAFKGDV